MSLVNKDKETILGKDLLLDLTDDLIIINSDYITTTGSKGFKQRLIKKLLSFKWSLFAHKTWGGFFQSLIGQLINNNNLNECKSAGKNQILEEDEVLDVDIFNVSKDFRTIKCAATYTLKIDTNPEEIQFITKVI